VLCYAGAALNQPTWDALRELSVQACGERVIFLSSLGSTETSPLALCCTWDFPRPGNIGVPAPGVTLKLIRTEGKLEARLRGPNITPGYWRQDHLTREAFDEEGYYKLGDAVKPADPDDLLQGYLFDGRLAEDFKLGTGTWVRVGVLRTAVLAACAPALQDLVVCGHDRDQVGILAWPNVAACRDLTAGDAAADPVSLARDPGVLAVVLRGIGAHNRSHPGASTRIARVHLMAEPPSIDANEVTDKGYINQRAVLERRLDLVHRLFADPPGPDVIVC
jgi:feruloyl-CoA synthase